ncbi:MAG TPA: right-handed parallel beta-helix repeat-containing protein, partial [Tepidisphaeraceae bacterium]|nr:right-handed parallel beta-helix repeat-containing protein [Tepidisphaeraceae bacterium]
GINLSASSNIQIQDNRIGSEADGTTSLGNQLDGVHLENSTSNLIYRNLIQGSGHVGVRIVDSSDNTVQAGNIGGSHSDGVLIVQSAGTASGNTIETTIGEGFTGLSLPNGGNGVDIVGASNNEINSNLLNNRLAGLEINGSTAVGNDFDGGLAYNNGKLGISIGDNIGTDHPNHQVNTGGGAGGGGPMLPDDGLNHPLITSASFDGTHTTITGTYLGDGNSQVSVEVYESNGADPSGFGEGERSVDSEDVTVPSDGNASFTLDGEEPPLYGANTVYSAIVERGTGSGGTDISEFSNAVKVVGASISGSVFNDVNGNGKQDPGEKGLAKQLVFVDRKGTGVFDDDIDPSAKTNSNGNFTLFGPPSGAIHLVTAVPSGFTQTLPNPKKPFYKINVAPLQHISGIIFGEEKAVAHIATIANPFNSTDSLDSKKRILDSLLSLI